MDLLEIYHRKAERYKELLLSMRLSGTRGQSRSMALVTVIPMDPPVRFRFCREAVAYRHLFNSKGRGKGQPSQSSSAACSSRETGERRSMACSPETCPDSCVRPSEVWRGGGPTSFIAALREVCDRKSRQYAVFKYHSR